MKRRKANPNAAKALEELKLEISNEMGIERSLIDSSQPINNIFTAGPVGGEMTKRLVKMGEEDLIDKYDSNNLE